MCLLRLKLLKSDGVTLFEMRDIMCGNQLSECRCSSAMLFIG